MGWKTESREGLQLTVIALPDHIKSQRVQTVWLQRKLDRLPFFFKKTGFFLDFGQPVVPRKHALFDLMEEILMIGIQRRK